MLGRWVKEFYQDNGQAFSGETIKAASKHIWIYCNTSFVFNNVYQLHLTLDYVRPNEIERQFNETKKVA